jgi:hypothetical protein
MIRMLTFPKISPILGVLRSAVVALVVIAIFCVRPATYFWNTLTMPTIPSYNLAFQVDDQVSENMRSRSFDTRDKYDTVLHFYEDAFQKDGWVMQGNNEAYGEMKLIRGKASKPDFCVWIAAHHWPRDSTRMTYVSVSLYRGDCRSRYVGDM